MPKTTRNNRSRGKQSTQTPSRRSGRASTKASTRASTSAAEPTVNATTTPPCKLLECNSVPQPPLRAPPTHIIPGQGRATIDPGTPLHLSRTPSKSHYRHLGSSHTAQLHTLPTLQVFRARFTVLCKACTI